MSELPIAVQIDNAVKDRLSHLPGPRAFVHHVENDQGAYEEVTAFWGSGDSKRRLEFAWPTVVFNNLSPEDIAGLIRRAADLELGTI